MIDVHSHLIPSVDDGSRSIDETMQMIREAKQAGFTDIILTSHYLTNYYETETSVLQIWTEQLQQIVNKEQLDVNLYSGNEVYVCENIDELIKKNKICRMANSKYLLIELPMSTEIRYFKNVIFTLKAMNITPIIAHPERYSFIQTHPERVQEWKDEGCLLQGNFASIIGLYGKDAQKTIKQLLKNNYVDFLGSDCHKPNTIYSEMDTIIKKIKKIISEEQLYKLTVENPKKILENK